jgi:hypothetical protein
MSPMMIKIKLNQQCQTHDTPGQHAIVSEQEEQEPTPTGKIAIHHSNLGIELQGNPAHNAMTKLRTNNR